MLAKLPVTHPPEGAVCRQPCLACHVQSLYPEQTDSHLWHGAGRSGEELFGSGGMGSSGSVQAMERNVARLFSERGPIFGEIAFTQNSILAGTPLSMCVFHLSRRMWDRSVGRAPSWTGKRVCQMGEAPGHSYC